MASGKLGSAALVANTDTTVYTVPALKVSTLNISITNRGSAATIVNVAISAGAIPANEEFIEYGIEIPANGILERSAIVAGAGERVIVRSSTANCSVRIHGFEENA